ncbi:MAG: DUF433 domain-containing protein [Patescibacteria group bacterium]
MATKNNIGGAIVIKQKVRFGKPCIKGTRIAIADILNLLKAGYAIEEIPEQYPNITTEDVRLALRYAARTMAKEEILEVAPVQ